MNLPLELDNLLIFKSALTTLLLVIVYVIHFITTTIVNKKVQDLQQRHNIRKLFHYFYIFSLLVMIFFLWIQHRSAFSTLIAVGGAGLIIALQDIVLSAFGWGSILIEGLYETGNRIEINGVKGDVIDISLLYTTLVEIDNWVEGDQSTGRIIKIPNNQVIKGAVFNYNKGFPFVWNEIKTTVTFESDWKKGKELLLDIVKEYNTNIEEFSDSIKKLSAKYLIYFSKLTPIVYTKIKDNGIELSLRHLTTVKKRRSNTSEIEEKILQAFKKEAAIDFAYPTVRYYTHNE